MLRFAPSPTGDMHIGNLRAAIFNYILAKQRGERFLIRIEDTDFARNIDGKDKEILQILTLFGLLWDDLVYQSHNFPHHRQLAQKLIDEGKAFYCYCDKVFLESKKQEAIEQKRAFRYDDSWAELHKHEHKKPVIRLRKSLESISYHDTIKGDLSFAPNELDSFVIMREDGVPTYNFACACDDMLYDISAIVRGEDHTSNTPKQILVHRALHYEKHIEYAHLPIILGESGKKMSKRDSASSVAWLLEQGFLPSAICNYLISMGNHTPCEVFTLHQAIEWFKLESIAKSPVRFDIARLRFLNHEHLLRLSDRDLALLVESKDESIGALARIYLEEASTLNELREKLAPILTPKNIDTLQTLCEKAIDETEKQDALTNYLQSCHTLLPILQDISQNPPLAYEDFKSQAQDRSGLKGKAFFKSLRILLTGSSHGPDIAVLYPIIRQFLKQMFVR